jgi:hypothetical protein
MVLSYLVWLRVYTAKGRDLGQDPPRDGEPNAGEGVATRALTEALDAVRGHLHIHLRVRSGDGDLMGAVSEDGQLPPRVAESSGAGVAGDPLVFHGSTLSLPG